MILTLPSAFQIEREREWFSFKTKAGFHVLDRYQMSAMRKKTWIFQSLLLLECFLVLTTKTTRTEGVAVEEKAETAIPVNTLSPPEGNTTFLDGTSWCVGRPGVSQVDLQNALDWACGLGMADCRPIQSGGPCFEPDTLLSHASYAFNTYYQQNGNSDIACNFGGTASLTKKDPSYGKCSYSTSGSLKASGSPLSKYKRSFMGWEIGAMLLLFCFRI